VQYYAPLFRELAARVDLTVFYCHRDTAQDQARAGFGQGFAWDVDLTSGYDHSFLENQSRKPELGSFFGVDTPEIGTRLREGNFDAVLVMGWYFKCFLQALFAAKRAGIPVMVRGDSQLGTPRSALKMLAKEVLYPPFLRLFDAALFVGEHNRAYWHHYAYPDARMFASPHCINTKWYSSRATSDARDALRQKLGISEQTPIALFAGKLIDFKRPWDVILAAEQVRKNGMPVEVLIAGSGPLEADLRALAKQCDVPLHMLGFCNQSQMPAAYAAADVLVLPSTARETWGLVANEAIACGKPVIVSDAVGCAPDLAGDGRAGLTFRLGDAAECAKAMREMLAHPPSSGVIEKISQNHSMETAANGIIKALEVVAKAGRSRPWGLRLSKG
jgi:glycosyltransferase involved in cell wall biosynthesis